MTSAFVVFAVFAVCPLCTSACAGGPADHPGGEGEGEGEGAEGEGEGASIAYRFETPDGAVVAGDVLDLGAHDTSAGAVVVDLALRNLGATDFAILTDPPLLVAGRDAAFFSVVTQPAAVVPAGAAVPFTLSYAPTSGGDHEGKLLFAYGLATADRAVLTVDAHANGPVTTPGVRFAIYDGVFTALPDFATLGASETGVIATFDISSRAGTDAFAFTFDGAIVADADGAYTFFTTSDDGSRLLVDGAVVVNNDGNHGPVEQSGDVTLTAGAHAIRVEFYEDAGGEQLTVEWTGPTVAREVIPASALFTDLP